MQTTFSLAQLADAEIKEAERILRVCVHCGFCNATCPTYQLLGDELDGPRGRIYQIKDLLEGAKPASAKMVKHIDRCLSCLNCMTTCPSGVNYMHLVDHARIHVEETYARPLGDRLLRALLALVLPRPRLFRWALRAAGLVRPVRRWLPGRLGGLIDQAPRRLPPAPSLGHAGAFPAEGARRKRVALLAGCAQQVLDPEINAATVRVLNRHGCEVVIAAGAGCCGALAHHMGKTAPALTQVKANVAAWSREIEGEGLDAIVINASGCGTTVKEYGFMLRDDPAWAPRAAAVAERACDLSELLDDLDLAAGGAPAPLTVGYHSACSLQHGQKIHALPRRLLETAGFVVRDIPEGHLCCGSAGTYNLLQPELAGQLRARKIANIASVAPDTIAAGNIGCISQLAGGTEIPVVHTVQLLDWATGGPKPAGLG
ncbi:MAG: glycolate oxidase subunit GlcF [Alphaproteobacteria bacterium]|nr:glycolate oxidase subunit GlcF [Alphaproteobacteria bacterium]